MDANQNDVSIPLETDQTSMGEVIVVGYGTQKKSDLTGSISSIKGSDLTHLSTQRVDQAIQGRAAGVYVLNTAGAPGANATIRVRGMNSINGGNNALVVVDVRERPFRRRRVVLDLRVLRRDRSIRRQPRHRRGRLNTRQHPQRREQTLIRLRARQGRVRAASDRENGDEHQRSHVARHVVPNGHRPSS